MSNPRRFISATLAVAGMLACTCVNADTPPREPASTADDSKELAAIDLRDRASIAAVSYLEFVMKSLGDGCRAMPDPDGPASANAARQWIERNTDMLTPAYTWLKVRAAATEAVADAEAAQRFTDASTAATSARAQQMFDMLFDKGITAEACAGLVRATNEQAFDIAGNRDIAEQMQQITRQINARKAQEAARSEQPPAPAG